VLRRKRQAAGTPQRGKPICPTPYFDPGDGPPVAGACLRLGKAGVGASKRVSTIISFALALLLGIAAAPLGVRAQEPQGLPLELTRALEREGIPLSAVGLYVQDLAGTEPLLTHRPEQPMNPASLMKLVTTYSALELLGPAYTWKTELYATGLQTGGIAGDLIVKGYGDPRLTVEDFWLALRELRARGLREIRGDLVLDDTYFDVEESDPNAFDGQGYRAYNVIPKALLVGFNAVNFRFVPDSDQGIVRVLAEPDLPPVHTINRMTLKSGTCPSDWRGAIGKDVSATPSAATVIFAGTFFADCGEKAVSLNLLSGANYTFALFQLLWRELGGSIAGGVRAGQVPQGARLLARRESRSLAEAARDINKFSNNVMARQLLLTLGAERAGVPGSVRGASAVIKKWLEAKKQDFSELVIENGAGLSRTERISAGHLGQLLLSASRSSVMPEFVASLPLAALDGTLTRRFENQSIRGQAHLKTGSLEGVKTMAGYVLDRLGRRVVVVFLVNHPRAAWAEGAQDALLEWVYERI
jgi:serine-type D-Ala-D-Ala carboxypeptidase/endopeptidase (penicillin-binding protein 4)